MCEDKEFLNAKNAILEKMAAHKYAYNFNFLGHPIIQLPQDMVAIQELIFDVKPDLTIETGIAHGGSLIMSASILTMLDVMDAIEQGVSSIDPRESSRKVIGVDIDIRSHNREALQEHPLASRIEIFQGSSISSEIVSQVKDMARNYRKVMVFLDSLHTDDHVLEELRQYALLTSKGSNCVVFDTVIENFPTELSINRPWHQGNNPMTAVWSFLETVEDFVVDNEIEEKFQLTVCPDGFLRRLK